jgi:hypothetical protein
MSHHGRAVKVAMQGGTEAPIMAVEIPEICTSAPGFDRRAFQEKLDEAVVECFRRAL